MKPRALGPLAFAIGLVISHNAAGQTLDPIRGVYSLADAIEPALKGVVKILNYRAGETEQPKSSGSGAIIDAAQGYVLTNYHVVDQAGGLKVVLSDGRTVTARLVGGDPATDLALLQIAERGLTAVEIADSSALRVGDVVVAVGYPFGLDQSVTSGIVSGLGRTGVGTQLEDFIQTDASINSGNSGGPLLDSRGRLVGVNTAIYSRSGGNVGIGFSVPSRIVQAVVAQLKRGGAVRRGVIGVQIDTSADDADVRGAKIAAVEPGSAAATAGVRAGDVVTNAGGEPVRRSADLRRIVGLTAPGSRMPVQVDRAGARLSFNLEVRAATVTTATADGAPSSLGANFAEIERGNPLAGLVSGVVVAEVQPGGLLSQNGLEAGDIITQVNQTQIHSLAEFAAALRENPGRKTFVIARGNALIPITIN